MSKSMNKAGGWVLAAIVVGILGLGAQRAMATPVNLDCPNDGYNYLGACVPPGDDIACRNACIAVGGPTSTGWCLNGVCCRCLH